jgi:5-methylcytosine-specific restriction endonuclease McrA
MTHDNDFIKSITVSTDKREHVNIHFKKWIDSLHEIVGFPRTEPRAYSLNYKKQLYDNNPTCQICGNKIQLLDDAEVDHIDFYWRGGKTIPSNARLVHRYCNRARGGAHN